MKMYSFALAFAACATAACAGRTAEAEPRPDPRATDPALYHHAHDHRDMAHAGHPAGPFDGAPGPASPAVRRVLRGDSVHFAGVVITTWVEVDAAGAPYAIGVTLPEGALDGVPDTSALLSLDLPAVDGLPFRHVLFDWAPTGHPPAELYAHPHWDAHFYLITREERLAIEAGAMVDRPAPEYLPGGFVPVPSLGLYSFPQMGIHWMDEEAAELHGHHFDQTLIFGTYERRTIFIEPMFTSAFLRTHPDLSAPVPSPAAVQESGFYPELYAIRYLPEQREYRISLERFRWRDAP